MAKKNIKDTATSEERFNTYMEELDTLKATGITDYAPILSKLFHERATLGLGYTGLLLIRIEEEVKNILKER